MSAPLDYESQPDSIRLLTRSIKRYPDEPANYLLRGEEWLARGFVEEARDDFLSVQARADALLSDSAWGYIYQAYIDRAEIGLLQCDGILTE